MEQVKTEINDLIRKIQEIEAKLKGIESALEKSSPSSQDVPKLEKKHDKLSSALHDKEQLLALLREKELLLMKQQAAGSDLKGFFASTNGPYKFQATNLSSNKRPYPEAKYVPLTLPSEEVVRCVEEVLARAADQSLPVSASTGVTHPHTSEPSANKQWDDDVGRPVVNGLQRCEYKITHELNGNDRAKEQGLPDWSFYYNLRTSPHFTFTGGEGKLPLVLRCLEDLVDHINGPKCVADVKCAVEQACSYCRDRAWSWSFITDVRAFFIIKREATHKYAISKAISCSDTNPTQRQALAYVLIQAYNEAKSDLERMEQEVVATGEVQSGRRLPQRLQPSQQPAADAAQAPDPAASGAGPSTSGAHRVRCTFSVPGGTLQLFDYTLGSGESGDVLLGSFNGIEAAVKMAEPSKEPWLVQQLTHEAKTLGENLKILQGVSVPAVLFVGFCHNDGLFCLATSLLQGQHPSSTMSAALPSAIQALKGIHGMGILHGDIRAENLLVEPQDASSVLHGPAVGYKVWFLDFGHSRRHSKPEECDDELGQLRALFPAEQDSPTSDGTSQPGA